jgi:hypothetical protein
VSAHGRDRSAEVLAERDEEIVIFDPVALGQLRTQGELALFRVLGFDIPPAVGDTMHMGVDADAGLAVAERDDEVRGLAPDTLQLQKLVNLVRDAAAVIVDQRAAEVADHFCLRMIKADGKDRLLDFRHGEARHRLGCFGEREQPAARLGGGRVLGAQAQDAGDQDLERTLGIFRDQGYDRCLPLRDFAPQDADRAVNFVVLHR